MAVSMHCQKQRLIFFKPSKHFTGSNFCFAYVLHAYRAYTELFYRSGYCHRMASVRLSVHPSVCNVGGL